MRSHKECCSSQLKNVYVNSNRNGQCLRTFVCVCRVVCSFSFSLSRSAFNCQLIVNYLFVSFFLLKKKLFIRKLYRNNKRGDEIERRKKGNLNDVLHCFVIVNGISCGFVVVKCQPGSRRYVYFFFSMTTTKFLCSCHETSLIRKRTESNKYENDDIQNFNRDCVAFTR